MYSGLILFLTAIPIIIVYFLKSLYLGALVEELNAGSISTDEYSALTLRYVLIYDGLTILSSFILSLGICGMTRVIRQIAWEEPLFFLKDFIDGIKMNYKNIVVHMFVLAVIYTLSDVALYVQMGYAIISYIPMGIFLSVVIPLALYNISQTNIYIITNFKATKNSALFLVKSIPVCLLFSIILASVLLLGFIPNFTIKLLIYILLLILAFPLYYLAWFLYSCSLFDKYINVNYYPEIVDKGIVRKEGYKKLEPTIDITNKEE